MPKLVLLALIIFIYDEEFEINWLYQYIIAKKKSVKRERKIVYELANDL